MATLYEQLSLQQDADSAAIEAAIDAQYNKWRKLVVHHDPALANQAERRLRALEQVRDVLLDPAKRAVYDQSLAVGGLADPEALVQGGMMAGAGTPPPPKAAPGTPAGATPEKRIDAWVCTGCQTPHPINTMHCTKCGARLGDNCPQCNTTVAIDVAFCPRCGVDINEAYRDKFQGERDQKIQSIRNQLATVDTQRAELEKRKGRWWYHVNNTPEMDAAVGCGIPIVTGIIFFMFYGLIAAPVAGLLIGWLNSPALNALVALGSFISYFLLWAGVTQFIFRLLVHRRINEKHNEFTERQEALQQDLARVQAEPLPERT